MFVERKRMMNTDEHISASGLKVIGENQKFVS
jgi:hypothetical protein